MSGRQASVLDRPVKDRKSGMPRWTVVCRAATSRLEASFCSAAARLASIVHNRTPELVGQTILNRNLASEVYYEQH